MEDNETYTVSQASDYLGLSSKTIHKYIYKKLIKANKWNGMWSYPGLADGLSVAIHSASWATALEVCSKFMGERYPSAECRRWELYQPSMY